MLIFLMLKELVDDNILQVSILVILTVVTRQIEFVKTEFWQSVYQ
jgi:hypothetical protein